VSPMQYQPTGITVADTKPYPNQPSIGYSRATRSRPARSVRPPPGAGPRPRPPYAMIIITH